MTAQQLHDQKLLKGIKLNPGIRKVLGGVLEKKSKSSKQYDAGTIARAMKRHSGLTREKAESCGF